MRGILIISLIVLLASCANKRQKIPAFIADTPFSLDTSLKNQVLKHQNQLYDLIGLNKLDNGTDSFELRIRIGNGLIAGLDIYSIKKDSSGWTGKHIYFQDKKFIASYLGKVRYSTLNTEVDSFWLAKKFVPQCGWERFIDSFNYYQLTTIRDQSQLPDCRLGGFDGESAIAEIATTNSYKYIRHWISGDSTCDEFVRFKSFIWMMQRQLGADFCWPRCWFITE